MTLHSVHGQKVGDHTESYGGHMTVYAMNVYDVKECLERDVDGKKLSKKIDWPQNMDPDLLVETMEGTGMLDSDANAEHPERANPDIIANVRAYVCQAEITGGFKKDIIIAYATPSPFFVSAKQGWTHYFDSRGVESGEGNAFWYTTQPDGTRGADFTDIINKNPNVALRPMPRMPGDVLELSQESIMFRPPPDALVLTKRNVHVRSKLLDAAVERIAQQGRSHDTRPSVAVPLYISPHELDQRVANALGSQLSQLDRIWKLDYEYEGVTDHIHGWRLLVHVHVDGIASQK